MVRASRLQPNVYFGRPGTLASLPYPRGDMEKPYDRQTFDFLTGTGQHMVSSSASGSRPYLITWNALHADNFALIEEYWNGQNGMGPWVFIDPSVRNMLLANQAAPTNHLMDTSGFATSTGAANMGTLISNTSSTFIHRTRGTRSLRWQFTVGAAASPQLNLSSAYRNWYGIPAVAGLPYTFTAWGRPDGVVDTAITLSAQMLWMNATGSQIGSATSGNINMNAGFVKLTATATAPAGTAYVVPCFIADGGTITTGASIYLDEMLLEQDSVANAWAPGTGVRAVDIMSLGEVAPFDARWRKAIGLSLRELA